MENRFEVNGVLYEPIPRDSHTPKSKSLSKIMMMAAAFQYIDPYSRTQKTKSAPKVDIVKEFELIQQKKSNLSRSERDSVVFIFNKNYRVVTNKINP